MVFSSGLRQLQLASGGCLGSYQTWILHSQQEAIGTLVLLSQLGAYLSSCHMHIIQNTTMCRPKCYMSEAATDIWRSADLHENYYYLISFKILTSLLFLTHFGRYFPRPWHWNSEINYFYIFQTTDHSFAAFKTTLSSKMIWAFPYCLKFWDVLYQLFWTIFLVFIILNSVSFIFCLRSGHVLSASLSRELLTFFFSHFFSSIQLTESHDKPDRKISLSLYQEISPFL